MLFNVKIPFVTFETNKAVNGLFSASVSLARTVVQLTVPPSATVIESAIAIGEWFTRTIVIDTVTILLYEVPSNTLYVKLSKVVFVPLWTYVNVPLLLRDKVPFVTFETNTEVNELFSASVSLVITE